MVGLVRRNFRDHIPVVLAQFLFSNSQYRDTHNYTWDQCDRLDAADCHPGIVDQEWLAQTSPHGGLLLALARCDRGTERASGDPDHALWRCRYRGGHPSASG